MEELLAQFENNLLLLNEELPNSNASPQVLKFSGILLWLSIKLSL